MDSGAIFYPLLLGCAILGVMFVASLGFSYLWLRAIDAQARTCPNCGRRGGGKLVHSELQHSRSFQTWKQARRPSGAATGRPRLYEVTEKTYEERYECRQCGHTWTRTAQESSQTPADN